MIDKYDLVKCGDKVIDLGSAPGGWSLIAAKKIGNRGKLIAVDLLHMDAIPGNSVFLQGDFRENSVRKRILNELGNSKANCILSDMAHNFCGDKETDHLRCISLCEEALLLASKLLRPGGNFCCKLLKGKEDISFKILALQNFKSAKFVKPEASRDASSEVYLVAKEFLKVE